MNNSKVLLVGFVILFFSAVSCSKKDPVVVVQPCAVTKITVTTSFGGGTATTTSVTTYEYNSDITLTKSTLVYSATSTGSAPFTSTTVTNYSYSGGALTSTSAGNAQSTWTNTNGAVTKLSGSTSDGTTTVLLTETFSYDAQGKVSAINYQDNLGVGTKVNNNFAFDGSSNLQTYKREVIYGSASQGLINTTYGSFDGKNNPYALLAKAIKQPYFISGVFGEPNEVYYSKNNIVASSSGSFPAAYTYEYSDANYPTKVVKTELGLTTTTLFEYQLCK